RDTALKIDNFKAVSLRLRVSVFNSFRQISLCRNLSPTPASFFLRAKTRGCRDFTALIGVRRPEANGTGLAK
ncbi:MAG: hypothetical protein ACJ754_14920, partial [Pyrinomonadaceae bacterium]